MIKRNPSAGRAGKCGVTLIELIVVIVVLGVIVASVLGIMLTSRRTTKMTERIVEAQQNARFAVDVMATDIRSAGYGADGQLAQGAIVYAAPFEIIFNANLNPYPDGNIPGYPKAINTMLSPHDIPPFSSPVHYSPSQTFGTGAETFRYTIDYNNDGVLAAGDRTSPEAARTENPNDYVLIKQVYGELGDGSNGGESQVLAVIRGPDVWPSQSTSIRPLFEYWLDNDADPTTPDVLFGDTDGDGELSAAEISVLNSPVPSPERITRVTINVIGETSSPYSGGEYKQVKVTTQVNTIRNLPPVFWLIRGHAYADANGNGQFDGGEAALDNIPISLNTGQVCATGVGGIQGLYEFSVVPGSYTVRASEPVGYELTTPSSFVVLAQTADVDSTTSRFFGLQSIPIGYLTGVVFNDSLYPNGRWDHDSFPPEPTIPGVKVEVLGSEQDTLTDSLGHYSFIVNAADTHIVREHDLFGYISTAAETVAAPGVSYVYTSPYMVAFVVAQDCTARVYFGDLSGKTGVIQGLVFEDMGAEIDSFYEPLDGDLGLPGVWIGLSQGTGASEKLVTMTSTDIDGSFSIVVPINPSPAESYNVIEADPPAYMSINANRVGGVRVENDGDTVDVRAFADRKQIIITLKGRALTIATPDLKEDTRVDKDIVIGKGVNGENLSVWYNKYVSPGEPPLTDLFNTNRDDARACPKTLYDLASAPINNDDYPDVLCGMDTPHENIWIWFTGTTGANKGKLPTDPAANPPGEHGKKYTTISGGDKVRAVATGLLGTPDASVPFNDNYYDVVVGTHKGVVSGNIEVWLNQRPSTIDLNCTASDVYDTGGQVYDVAVGDVVGASSVIKDGIPDIIVGTRTAEGQGKIIIFRNLGTAGPGNFQLYKTFPASGEVWCVGVLDLLEDVDNDQDIVIGTKTGSWTGKVEIWHNNSDGTFGQDDTLATYTANPGGMVRCLGLARIYPDVYPDIALGTKTGDFTGMILLYDLAYGRFPWGGPVDPSGGTETGTMRALNIADFDKNGNNDFIVGERTGVTEGKLVIFYY